MELEPRGNDETRPRIDGQHKTCVVEALVQFADSDYGNVFVHFDRVLCVKEKVDIILRIAFDFFLRKLNSFKLFWFVINTHYTFL